jgi:hypothetical protein
LPYSLFASNANFLKYSNPFEEIIDIAFAEIGNKMIRANPFAIIIMALLINVDFTIKQLVVVALRKLAMYGTALNAKIVIRIYKWVTGEGLDIPPIPNVALAAPRHHIIENTKCAVILFWNTLVLLTISNINNVQYTTTMSQPNT